MTIARRITDLIGHTPLVRLNRISDETGAEVLGKLESFNPGGSVKDRIGLAMIEAAEREGADQAGQDDHHRADQRQHRASPSPWSARRAATRSILTMPETMTIERRNLLKAYGAQLVLTPGSEGMKGAIARAQELAGEIERQLHPAAVPEPGQPRDPLPHDGAGDLGRHGRQRRRLRRGGRHRRHGHRRRAGSCASASPTSASSPSSRSTRRCSPAVRPGPHKIQGIGAGFVPDVLDTEVYEEVVQVTADQAFQTARALAREEGILVGISAGANVWAAAEVARRPAGRGHDDRDHPLRHGRALPLVAALHRADGGRGVTLSRGGPRALRPPPRHPRARGGGAGEAGGGGGARRGHRRPGLAGALLPRRRRRRPARPRRLRRGRALEPAAADAPQHGRTSGVARSRARPRSCTR